MIAAVFKVSYTALGQEWPVVTLIGTAFFVRPRVALTARHILPPARYAPDDGFTRCEYWLLGQAGLRIQFAPRHLTRARGIDAMRIDVPKPCNGPAMPLGTGPPAMGEMHAALGYADPSAMARPYVVRPRPWTRTADVLEWFDLPKLRHARRGVVDSTRTATVAAADVRLDGVNVIEFRAGGVQGMSGGPLVHEATGRAVGVLSFGLPNEGKVKDVVYAMPMAAVATALDL
ncbi:hypothetical protein HN371_09485 [Candidatus Poribacteria bacterium]|mgnify:CR=1 FL=1|nr:hypothetical protein [Candidatus Poribacteria bacterium]MBT5533231.1 hypothetical protein [Candidatus Poribacteria bacterium]MBT7097989.1 hypothetical protein [Candidatus Poribacteria bacterium]MBT7809646.1 hypothetical protein [Candidatus Poribacteria bacterium]